jgi:hypothetical protein
MANQDVADFDELFEDCYPDGAEGNREAFSNHIEELEGTGYLIALKEGDRVLYKARDGLKWDDFHPIDCPIKKRILLYLSENPQAFFILFNTQKGKLGLVCKEIRAWMSCPERIVGFLFLDNSKDLAQQSLDAMKDRLVAEGFHPFLLSSSTKVDVENIKTYIDAYEYNKHYKMPVILALANAKQGAKVAGLLKHISDKCENGSNLRHGVIFDEADAVYPVLREMLKPYLIDKTAALHRVGWVSATEGSLLDEEYQECANAHQQQECIDPIDEANYRALHLPEAIMHPMEIDRRDSNNVTALKLLIDNAAHFKRTIRLRDGSYMTKTIINSDGRVSQMESFAYQCVTAGYYALTYNQTGIKLYRRVLTYNQTGINLYRRATPAPPTIYKTKGKRFNELLFYIFETNGLYDKPAVIIGRRKIDRGLSFHYAPRPGAQPKLIEGKEGPLQTDGVKGLIWTDLILGKIDDKARATQKAGRGAAIMAHCPQYPGEIHYWMHPDTAKMVKMHNETVDQRNMIVGSNSALQAHVRATAIVAAAQPPPKNHEVDANMFRIFRDEAAARGFCDVMGYTFRKPQLTRTGPATGFIQSSLNQRKEVLNLLVAIKAVPTQYGGEERGGWRTLTPCYKDVTDPTTLRYLIFVRWNPDKTVEDPVKLAEADRLFPAVPVPQTGPLDAV